VKQNATILNNHPKKHIFIYLPYNKSITTRIPGLHAGFNFFLEPKLLLHNPYSRARIFSQKDAAAEKIHQFSAITADIIMHTWQ